MNQQTNLKKTCLYCPPTVGVGKQNRDKISSNVGMVQLFICIHSFAFVAQKLLDHITKFRLLVIYIITYIWDPNMLPLRIDRLFTHTNYLK